MELAEKALTLTALDEAGKRAVVANCAVARELACWCWALGCMVEAA